MNSIRLITSIVIIAFLCQNIAWAKGPTMLTPDNKRILSGIVEILGLDPGEAWKIFNNPSLINTAVSSLTEQERARLVRFLQVNIDNNLPENVRLIFTELLQSQLDILITGGTICMSSRPARSFSGQKRNIEELTKPFREKISSIIRVLRNPKDSSDLGCRDIIQLVRVIKGREKPLVITHGTDLLAETGLALSLFTQRPKHPIVLVASFDTIDQPDSDASPNMRDAINLAADPFTPPFVYVVINGEVHLASRIVKVDTKKGGIQSFGGPVGEIKDGKIKFSPAFLRWARGFKPKHELVSNFGYAEIMYSNTHTPLEIYESVVNRLLNICDKVGLVIEGEIPNDKRILDRLKRLSDHGIPIYAERAPFSRCTWINKIPSGLSIMKSRGKLAILLGQGLSLRRIKEKMREDISGEIVIDPGFIRSPRPEHNIYENPRNYSSFIIAFQDMDPDIFRDEIKRLHKKRKKDPSKGMEMVIEGHGDGHIQRRYIKILKKAVESGIQVVMLTNAKNACTNLDKYPIGRELKNAGVIGVPLPGRTRLSIPSEERPYNLGVVLFGLSPALISMLGFVSALLWTEHGGWWGFRKEIVEYVRLQFSTNPMALLPGRRRFLRNAGILLAGAGLGACSLPGRFVKYALEPLRLSQIKKRLIEEFKVLAAQIEDPVSRRYAINFLNLFIEKGVVIDFPELINKLDMKYSVFKFFHCDGTIIVNYPLYKLWSLAKPFFKATMVHEGDHITKYHTPDDLKLRACSIGSAWDYLDKVKGTNVAGFKIDDLIDKDGKWKRFPGRNFLTYQLVLLSVYNRISSEASGLISEYNYLRSVFGDLREYLRDFKLDTSRQKAIDQLQMKLENEWGDIDRIEPEHLAVFKKEGLIPPDITWEGFSEYLTKTRIYVLLNKYFGGAIREDGSIDDGKVKKNYLMAEDLPDDDISAVFFIEHRRGTISDPHLDNNLSATKIEFLILDEERFLDWMDTGIFVDENGNAIDLMKLDFTPDTHGVLPKLIPPFVIGTTQGSLDKEAIESLMLFVSQKYVEGKEQDEASSHAIEYLRNLGKGAYLDELHRVFTGLRKTAKLVQERYPLDKCWDTASVRDMTKGMGWVKEFFADAPMLELECRTDRFECSHSIFVMDWLVQEGIKARPWLVNIPKRYLGGDFTAVDGKAGHVVNLIEIDDPSPTDKLSSTRIVMGITPLDRLYGLYPYGVINHTDYETHIINEGKEISPQREEILRQRLDFPFLDLCLNGYEEHDPRYPTFSTIVVNTHEDIYTIFARSALYRLEGIVGMELPAGAIAIMLRKDKVEMAAKEVEKFLQEDPSLLSLSGKELDILRRWQENGWLRFAGGHYIEGLTPEIKDAIDEGLKTALQDVFRIVYKLANVKEGIITVGRTGMVKKIYPDLLERIKDICPDWRPISMEELCKIVTTGRIPLDWPELVSAMRADGIIDEADFRLITAIGEAVDKAAEGVGLTVNDKALLTEVIAIRYLLSNAGELRDRLNSLGYGSKADRIILLLRGIKKNKPRHRTDYDFIKGLEKLSGYKLDDSGLNLADIRGNGENHLTRHWLGIFELNLRQWKVLELLDKKKPKGIIVQDIRDLGPGVQNWLEGIKRYNIDMSGVKMAYVTDGLSDADMERLMAIKPANVILVQGIKELCGQGEDIVYLASRERLVPYKEQGLRLVERGHAGPVIELSWCLLMLAADDIGNAYKQFVDKLVSSGLITKEQIQELEDPFYIRLPKAEKVLEMWDELQEGTSYLDIWA